jgi:carbamate kinase
MTTSAAPPAGRARPLDVIALGGNAISPPRGDLSIEGERAAIAAAVAELAALARAGRRLLVVHGNGPQVGRLLAAPGLGALDSLDVHVAQTQGELGYLLAQALEARPPGEPWAALVTRVLVDAADPEMARPAKPIGAVLAERPPGVDAAPTPDGRGWRRVVASPRPLAVVEEAAIAALLATHHVVAGGGGGIPLVGAARRGAAAVVDKDRVAALLAVALAADRLVFVTDVPHAFDRFGAADQRAIPAMTAAEARRRLAGGAFAPGSMAPKVESAAAFAEATGRPAVITAIGAVDAALGGRAGTRVTP